MKSSGRKALQPRNIFLVDDHTITKQSQFLKPKTHRIIPKENLLPPPILVESSSIHASLAEELSAFKKKLERLRDDREKTEMLLKVRDEAMDLEMTHLLERAETQKSLEIQVDRLFRLKELHAYSSKISPIQSLRTKEQQKRKSFSFEVLVDEEPGEEISSVKKDLEIQSPLVQKANTKPPFPASSSSSSTSL